MIEHEWVHLTTEQFSTDPALIPAIKRFQAPPGRIGDVAAGIGARQAYRSRPDVELSCDGQAWLEASLQRALTQHGRLGPSALKTLDWLALEDGKSFQHEGL